MRKFIVPGMTLAVMVGFFSLGLSPGAGANVIVNGDMEGGTFAHGIPNNWWTTGASLNLDSSNDVSGTGGTTSLVFTNLNGPITDYVTQNFVPIVGGATYQLDFEYKTTGGGIYGVFDTDAGDTMDTIAAESLVWTNGTPYLYVAPLAATQARMTFYGIGNQETIYLDNVSLSLIPEPGSIALLGLSGLTLFVRRRDQES